MEITITEPELPRDLKVSLLNQPEIFSNLDEHVDSNLASHKVAMVKKIVTIYVSLRLKHFCREKNNNVSNKMIRTKLTKLILFQGQ